MVRQRGLRYFLMEKIMKYMYIFYLTILAAMSSCSCGCSEDIRFTYPKYFEPLKVNENTAFFSLPGFKGIFSFNTDTKKILYKYGFTGYSEISYYQFTSNNEFIFIIIDENDNNREVTVSKIIQITVSTGEVKEVPFYDDMPSFIEMIDGKLWVDSAYTDIYPRKVQIYDPLTGEINYMNIPHRFTGQPAGHVEENYYTSVSASGHEPLLNCSTGEMVDTVSIFGEYLSKYSSSYPKFCSDLNNKSSAYLGFYTYNTTKTNNFPLFKIDSIDRKEFKLIINSQLTNTGRFYSACELNGYLYLVSYTEYTVKNLLIKMNTENYSIESTTVLPEMGGGFQFKNNKFWYRKTDSTNVYSVDPETLVITEHVTEQVSS